MGIRRKLEKTENMLSPRHADGLDSSEYLAEEFVVEDGGEEDVGDVSESSAAENSSEESMEF